MKKADYLQGLGRWERIAYHLDVLRVFPRVLILAYTIAAGYVGAWFMGLKDPSGPAAAFVSTVAGIAPLMLSFYCQNGVDWTARMVSRGGPVPK